MEINNWYNAIDNKNFKVIKQMIQNEFDVIFDHNYAFRMAAYKGSLKLMTLLLENGANIDTNKSYALRTSIYQNNIDCVKFLVKWGALISKKSLEIAIEEENVEIAELLIENGADLDMGSNKFFVKCIETEQYDFVKYLLNKNMPLYFQNDVDYKIFDHLMYIKQYEIVELILKNGIEPHKLFPYAFYNGKKMIGLLHQYGLDYKKIDKNELCKQWKIVGDEFFFDLIEKKKFKMVKLLLKVGVEPHILFPYSIHGGLKLVKFLYESGMDCSKINNKILNDQWNYNEGSFLESDKEMIKSVRMFILKNDFTKKTKETVLEDLFPPEYVNHRAYCDLLNAGINMTGFNLNIPDDY